MSSFGNRVLWGVVCGALLVGFGVSACASDDTNSSTNDGGVGSGGAGTGRGTGGSNPAGGAAGAVEKNTGGSNTGGVSGSGTGGKGAIVDGGCAAPMTLVYENPGCDQKPKCAGPLFDSCVAYACACDGTVIGGCGNFAKPWIVIGPCSPNGD
jgi:hypothetical protein